MRVIIILLCNGKEVTLLLNEAYMAYLKKHKAID